MSLSSCYSYFLMGLLLLISIGCQKAGDELVSTNQRENRPPSIQRLSSNVSLVAVSGVAALNCQATDPDGDPLTYMWTASQGSVSGSSTTVSWTAPNAPCTAVIAVTVADSRGGSDTASLLLICHRNSSQRILIDASRDGGVWWFPQSEATGFSPTEHHQGKALADYLRSRGFEVDELPRTATISDSLLNWYDKVIVAASHYYAESDIQKYLRFTERRTSLILIGEYLRRGQRNLLAERFGVRFAGIAYGSITRYAQHQITQGARPFSYHAGAAVIDTASNASIQFLGWLSEGSFVDLNDNGLHDPNEPAGMPVMGVVAHPTAKIFFLGELNGLESVPQPLVSNLVSWAF